MILISSFVVVMSCDGWPITRSVRTHLLPRVRIHQGLDCPEDYTQKIENFRKELGVSGAMSALYHVLHHFTGTELETAPTLCAAALCAVGNLAIDGM